MGRGSPLCAKLHERIVSSKTMFLSVRLQRFEIFHQFIMLGKDSGSQGKSWCVKAKGGNGCWTREPSSGTVWETVLLPWHGHMGLGVLWKIIVTQHSPQAASSNASSNLKLYHAKRKEFINFAQKRRRVLWARSHLRWTKRRWKRVLRSDESTFQLVFGKHGVERWNRPSRLLPTKSAKNSFC